MFFWPLAPSSRFELQSRFSVQSSFKALQPQKRYGGHKVNINIGDSVPTMSEALGEEASAILASLGKEE